MQFFFDDHALDTDRRELYRGPEAVAVEPQVFDLLVFLVQNRDHVVSKDDLIEAVWGGRIVSESTLSSRINAARRAVGVTRQLLTLSRKKLLRPEVLSLNKVVTDLGKLLGRAISPSPPGATCRSP